MENGIEGIIPSQQTETSSPVVGIPVTETSEPKKGLLNFLKKLFNRKKEEPTAVGSGMAEQLAPSAAPLDRGTTDRTDFATASTATADTGASVDVTSVLDDVTKQLDNTAQMTAHVNNPMPGIPSIPMENPTNVQPPEVPPATASQETVPTAPPTEQAA